MDTMLALGSLSDFVLGALLGIVIGVVGAPAFLFVLARGEWRRASSQARSAPRRVGHAPASAPAHRHEELAH